MDSLDATILVFAVGMVAFLLAASAVKPANARDVRRVLTLGVAIGGVLQGVARSSPAPGLSAFAGFILFVSLMAVIGTFFPSIRRRDEALAGFRERVEEGGGVVNGAQRLVMPIKGIPERTANFYAIFTSYGERSGVWYVCERHDTTHYWIWKDSAGQTSLPAKTPHGSVSNDVVVVSGIWVIIIGAAAVGALIVFVLWVANASQ